MLNGSKSVVNRHDKHMLQRVKDDAGQLLHDEWDLNKLEEVIKVHCATEWKNTKSRISFYLFALATLTSTVLNVWFLSYKV